MTGWFDQAACRGRPTAWWFSGDRFGQQVAVLICRSCPVRAECLDAALDEEADAHATHRFGVRGGVIAEARVALRGRVG